MMYTDTYTHTYVHTYPYTHAYKYECKRIYMSLSDTVFSLAHIFLTHRALDDLLSAKIEMEGLESDDDSEEDEEEEVEEGKGKSLMILPNKCIKGRNLQEDRMGGGGGHGNIVRITSKLEVEGVEGGGRMRGEHVKKRKAK